MWTRRRWLAAAGAAGMVPVLGACKSRPHGVNSDVAALPSKLAALETAVTRPACSVTLRSGRSADELAAAARAAGVELPRELAILWAWHDGEDESDRGFLFRDQHLLSSDDALDRLDLAANLADRDDHFLIPFASFEGQAYCLPASPWRFDARFERPVIAVGDGVSVYFHSLGHLIDTQLAWIADGRCELSAGAYAHDRERELAPWRRINPGLF